MQLKKVQADGHVNMFQMVQVTHVGIGLEDMGQGSGILFRKPKDLHSVFHQIISCLSSLKVLLKAN